MKGPRPPPVNVSAALHFCVDSRCKEIETHTFSTGQSLSSFRHCSWRTGHFRTSWSAFGAFILVFVLAPNVCLGVQGPRTLLNTVNYQRSQSVVAVSFLNDLFTVLTLLSSSSAINDLAGPRNDNFPFRDLSGSLTWMQYRYLKLDGSRRRLERDGCVQAACISSQAGSGRRSFCNEIPFIAPNAVMVGR